MAGGYNLTAYNEAYDISGDSWSSKSNCPIPAHFAAGSLINNEFHMFGGIAGTSTGKNHSIYNPTQNSWRIGPMLFNSEPYASCADYNNEATYIVGTNNAQFLYY